MSLTTLVELFCDNLYGVPLLKIPEAMFIRSTNRILSIGKFSIVLAAYGEGGDIKYDFSLI
jgi:hypothetical protein